MCGIGGEQTHGSVEQNRDPRDRLRKMQPFDKGANAIQCRKKVISSESVAGITGHPYRKNEPGQRSYTSHKS